MTDLDISGEEYKIISYPVEAGGTLGAGRDEITGLLRTPFAIAFSGGRAYVADGFFANIVSYPVEAGGRLGAERDEMAAGLKRPIALALSGGRAYVADSDFIDDEYKIISYPLLSSAAFAVAPDAPRVVAQSDSAASITWNAVLGATHYKLYRSKTSDGLFAQVGGDISITRYRDDGLAGNTSYDYQLEACNSGGCSDRSPVGSAITAPAIPSAPTVAAQSDSAISIAWSAVAGATHYNLYRSDASEGLFAPIGREIVATDYADSGLFANTFYDYRLEACNDNGCSGHSPVGSATTAPAIPSPPTVAAQSDSAISIAWSAVAGATHYNLYRATVSGGAYMQVGGDIAATGYLDSGLSETTAYYYQLEVCNSGGCSGRSPEVSATTYATGSLGARRDEITTDLNRPTAIAFSGGRAYVADGAKIISYPVEASGELGVGRDEITTGLSSPRALAFSGGRAYVAENSYNNNSGNDVGKIISYPVGVDGKLGAARDEITAGLSELYALAFSDGRVYVGNYYDRYESEYEIISYPVGADGRLGAGRDEITAGLSYPRGIAFSGGRIYVAGYNKIISYPVGAGGILGAARNEITTGFRNPSALAFSGGRAYVAESEYVRDPRSYRGKIISYPVGMDGRLGAGRDEITAGLSQPRGIAFSGGAGLYGGLHIFE